MVLEDAITQLKSLFEIEKRNPGAYETVKKSGMTFHIQWYYVKGVGNLSILTASGMLGLMKMDTLIFTPYEKDLPLFSYDLMRVMNKHTFLIEYFDTCVSKDEVWKKAASKLNQYKLEASSLKDCEMKNHWYDSMELPQTVEKCGSKKDKPAFDELFKNEWELYLHTAKQMPDCSNMELKRNKTRKYVDGLFEYGGPSTDVFVKMIGKEAAIELFSKVIFGTK